MAQAEGVWFPGKSTSSQQGALPAKGGLRDLEASASGLSGESKVPSREEEEGAAGQLRAGPGASSLRDQDSSWASAREAGGGVLEESPGA